eukprot:1159205-Pelagomonas_calceolata.AAC.6
MVGLAPKASIVKPARSESSTRVLNILCTLKAPTAYPRCRHTQPAARQATLQAHTAGALFRHTHGLPHCWQTWRATLLPHTALLCVLQSSAASYLTLYDAACKRCKCNMMQMLLSAWDRRQGNSKHGNVMTVDKAQGSEADVVVLSLVKIGAFMLDTKRANVALSRARKLSILVGNVEYMKRDAGSGRFWNQVIDGYVAATRGVAPALSVAQLRRPASLLK